VCHQNYPWHDDKSVAVAAAADDDNNNNINNTELSLSTVNIRAEDFMKTRIKFMTSQKIIILMLRTVRFSNPPHNLRKNTAFCFLRGRTNF
jgi:hypothetical protein